MTEKHYSPAYLAYMDLHKPTESGRYAEAGYNDHFNDGLDALWDALEEAGIVRELALDPEPWVDDTFGTRCEVKLSFMSRFAPREGYEQEGKYYQVTKPLDPLPWRHSCWDDGTCDAIGERHETKGVNDEFDPREGYEQDRSKYE